MIKVRVGSNDFGNIIIIGIFDEGDGRSRIAKPMNISFIEYDEMSPSEPTLKLPHDLAVQLFHALAEALDKQGIKTDNDHKIAGILEATRYHLEDMRLIAGVKK